MIRYEPSDREFNKLKDNLAPELEELEQDDNICNTCAGTGEGRHGDSVCTSCNGSGTNKKHDNDYDPGYYD